MLGNYFQTALRNQALLGFFWFFFYQIHLIPCDMMIVCWKRDHASHDI